MNNELIKAIEATGREANRVEQQLAYFRKGFPYLTVDRAASIGDGILRLDKSQVEVMVKVYEDKQPHLHVVKFIPASGAASRMFKQLFEFMESDDNNEPSDFIQTFIDGLDSFAFRGHLDTELSKNGSSLQDAINSGNYKAIIKGLLVGLNYGELPKGLLHFHEYEGFVRTPVQEHFAEGVAYAKGAENKVRLHFTVSPEHQQLFEDHVEQTKKELTDFNFDVKFSRQKKSTDTIAVTPDNEPFYEDDGSLLFRPAGHGALIENLNEIEADVIFIKNIDNVVPDYLKADTIHFKKVIAGILLNAQEKVFDALHELDENHPDLEHLTELARDLYIDMGTDFESLNDDEKAIRLKTLLNRPIRVCGIVKNTGEPGGGPFWAVEGNGRLSLQIAETAQLDPNDEATMDKLIRSTHFSPTDLVCGVRNYKGEKFDLLQYRDPDTGFISEKSKSGRKLKALELPGLWNGAMADWITLFCEVPLITFNPVKTVNDLLRPEHQPA
ncbi:MAG: DUF4301 family protein [Bacteroidota bacterium]